MHRNALAPVFLGLRVGLHLLVVGVAALVVVLADPADRPAVAALAAALLAVYAAGAAIARARRSGWTRAWLAVLSVLWLALVVASPQAAYLVFPLYFLYLHLLPRRWGPAAVVVATLAAVVATAADGGLTVGGVVGPVIAAGVALAIGLGYRALAREAAEREQLLAELVAARADLAASERTAGALAERARIARDLHDTVAQGLSSIQMLLHVAERADPGSAGVQHIRLARETAAGSLGEARALIAELTPPPLAEQGLLAALRRLAVTQWSRPGLQVEVDGEDDDGEPPVQVATALLRIAQGAVANALQHSGAGRVQVRLDRSPGVTRLAVQDDGRGFDPAVVAERTAGGAGHFGLRAVRERVEQLGGALAVRTAPGRGTEVEVELPDAPAAAAVPGAEVMA
ncbi:Signal transduction histidine kinase [Quadrisphaera granulorum]|uniref:Oxygen sensor histidine kinase NreB n=1 Tax=Quadrisphaera granulorum TaxID=317664 RepID=A0A316A9X3_9ACTN|nr:sensor histidine kinase [Quadrisphaera granulorum]PWJ53998.1 signal transduction histidine kinase [Quadrisphaera granulorum]SZE96455.1 Signal transduction histidine kinase [Quadrisphaera granulorum]